MDKKYYCPSCERYVADDMCKTCGAITVRAVWVCENCADYCNVRLKYQRLPRQYFPGALGECKNLKRKSRQHYEC